MTALQDLAWPRGVGDLLVRPASTTDAPAVWRVLREPGVGRWTSFAAGGPEAHAERYADDAVRASRLVVELDETVVGELSVRVGDAWAQATVADRAAGTEAEVGWCLATALRGRGLGTALGAFLLEVCLAPAPRGLGLRRMTANCFAANEASWRLMERIGMRREAHGVRDSLHAELGWLDGFTYALLAEEWTTRRSSSAGSPDRDIRNPAPSPSRRTGRRTSG